MVDMLVGMVLICLGLGGLGIIALVLLLVWNAIDAAATRRVNRMVRSAGVKPVNVKRSPLASQPILCDVCRRVVHPARPRPGQRDMPAAEYERAARAHLSTWPRDGAQAPRNPRSTGY